MGENARPTEPCPFYHMPCEYVPMARAHAEAPDWQSIATEAMRLLQAHIGSWRDDEVKALEDRFRAAGGVL